MGVLPIVYALLSVITLFNWSATPTDGAAISTVKLGGSTYSSMQALDYTSGLRHCRTTAPPSDDPTISGSTGEMVDNFASTQDGEAFAQLCTSLPACWTNSNKTAVEVVGKGCPYMMRSLILVSGLTITNFNLNFRACHTPQNFVCGWKPGISSPPYNSGGLQSSLVAANKLLTLQPAATYVSAVEACSSLPGNGALVDYLSPDDPAIADATEHLCAQVSQCWIASQWRPDNTCPYIVLSFTTVGDGSAVGNDYMDCNEPHFFVCQQDVVGVEPILADPPQPSGGPPPPPPAFQRTPTSSPPKQATQPNRPPLTAQQAFGWGAGDPNTRTPPGQEGDESPAGSTSGDGDGTAAIVVATVVPVVVVAAIAVSIYFYMRHKRVDEAVERLMHPSE